MTPTRPAESARSFLALHHGPGFVLPKAWDPGSARILEQVGFPAIATTSAGIAWAAGIPDPTLITESVLSGLRGCDLG